jgi:hypothetical protein
VLLASRRPSSRPWTAIVVSRLQKWIAWGAAVGQVELKLHDAWDRLLDFAIAAWLGLLDRLAPLPETPVDRAIREEGERPRKAFPRSISTIQGRGPPAARGCESRSPAPRAPASRRTSINPSIASC